MAVTDDWSDTSGAMTRPWPRSAFPRLRSDTRGSRRTLTNVTHPIAISICLVGVELVGAVVKRGEDAVVFAVDLVGVRGSGTTAARINLLRRAQATPEYWTNKKMVIWVFAAREFSESDGWREVPID